MIGRSISHYEIVEELGEGGMGVVYKALDTKLQRHVAIKFLPPHLKTDRQAKKRFVREAQAASALNHSNIAVVHDINETPEGQMYIVMAYYEGRTLKDRHSQGALGVDDAITVVTQIASALSAARAKDILHRDIKPANILFGTDGQAKLADFGLAKLAGQTRVTKTGTTVGTVAYMSPEQASGRDMDHRSDLFSLGVVFYELLTGTLPFPGDHEAAVIYGIMNTDPAPLSQHRPGLPDGLQQIVDRLLAKEPASRYSNADELISDLRAFTGDSGSASLAASKSHGAGMRTVSMVAVAALIAFGSYFAYTNFWKSTGASDSTAQSDTAAQEGDFVVAIAPFWGPTGEAIEEGKVMQALIERQIRDLLEREEEVKILGSDITTAPRNHDEARALRKEVGGSMVIWGEVLALRGEVEVQPYITLDESMTQLYDANLDPLQATLTDPNQLSLRKGKAEEMGNVALITVASFRRRSDPEKALSLLQKSGSPTAEVLRWQGRIYRDQHKYDEALRAYEQALEMEPENKSSYTGRGVTYYFMGQLDAAATQFEKAIEIDSTDAWAHDWLGYIYRQAGRDDDAIAQFERAILLDPDFEKPYENLSFLHREARRWEQAADALNRLLERKPKSAVAYMGLGWVYRWTREYDKALAAFQKALDLRPGWAPAANGLADVYGVRGETERALEMYEKVFEMDPDFYFGRAGLGWFYARLGRYEEAAVQFDEALRINPNEMNAINGRFRCYLRTGSVDEAVPWLEGLTESYPDRVRLENWLGVSLTILGDFENAMAAFERASVIDPSETFVRLHLFLARSRAGKYTEARTGIAAYIDGMADESYAAMFVRYFAGEVREDAVFEAMNADEPEETTRRLCEAYYYVGLGHLLGATGTDSLAPADTARAVEYFEKCIATGVQDYYEPPMAEAELARLGRR